jgi:hypothetical protein
MTTLPAYAGYPHAGELEPAKDLALALEELEGEDARRLPRRGLQKDRPAAVAAACADDPVPLVPRKLVQDLVGREVHGEAPIGRSPY